MDDDFQNNPAHDYLPQNNFHGLFDENKHENKPADGTQILRVILRKPSSPGYFYVSIFGSGCLSALFCFSDDPFGSFFSFLPSILLRHKSAKPA